MITTERLRELVTYDPETGVFRWKIHRSNKCRIGDVAGTDPPVGQKNRYVLIRIDDRLYRAHRLVWLYVYGKWPTLDVDHIDGNGLNNSLNNLRECTMSQNLGNSRRHKDNHSGVKGVSWNKDKKKWKVRIKGFHLGYFDSLDDAAAVYEMAAKKVFGDFARLV